MKPERILVTGGMGFIGSHLVRRLIALGYKITVLDDLSRANPNNLGDVREEFRFVRSDIRNEKLVQQALNNIDTVFHLAALTDVQESWENPFLYNQVNVGGTANLLSCCVKSDVRKFVYLSSCAVYGDPVQVPINENHPTIPLSPYAASKLSAESYCWAYSKAYGSKVLILRPFNVYGPGQSAGVIANFISRMKTDKPPIIFGDGEQTRDFIHIYDVSEYMVNALAYEQENGVQVINIGSGKPTTIRDLAKLIPKMSGKEYLKPIYEKPKKGEIKLSVADISEALDRLGYSPQYTLEKGLAMVLNASYVNCDS